MVAEPIPSSPADSTAAPAPNLPVATPPEPVSPTPAAVPPMPGSPVNPVDPSLGLPVDHDAAATPPPVAEEHAPKSKKKLLIIAGIVLAALLIAGGVWVAFGMGGSSQKAAPADAPAAEGTAPATTAPDTSELGGSTTAASTPGSNPAAAITYGVVTRPCYSFSLPTPNNASNDATSCAIDSTFGRDSASRIVVIPSTTVFNSLEEALAAAKKAYTLGSPVDKKISMGGSDAYETTYTSTSGKKAVKIIVNAYDRNYKLASATITGFEINMPANSTTDLAAVTKLETTWAWK